MASQLKRNRRTKVQVKAVREAAREELAAHHPMTLRQVHYRLVSRDDIVHPNTISAYGTLSAWLRDDRLEGDIPWSWMEDRMRVARGWSGWDDPGEFLGEVLSGYYRDPWQDETQNHYVEVWLEKDALAGVLVPVVVEECGLDLHVTRGYASVSYLQSAADYIRRDGRPTHVYLLTDFDPSGLGIADTVASELVRRSYPVEVRVERLAVDRRQIDLWNLPTRPTKASDSRAGAFVRDHGTDSVELDAIPPGALRAVVREAVERHMDPDRLRVMRLAEEQERDLLRKSWVR